MIWNKNKFHCDFVIKEDHFLAVIRKWEREDGFIGCVNVYGPRHQKERAEVWAKLDQLCKKEEVSWPMFGDFNEVRGAHKRLNSLICDKGTKEFNSFI